jgi:hypothetical protein
LGFPWSEFAAAHANGFIFERRAVLHSSKKEERSPEKLMASWSAANFDELRKFDACRVEPVWLRA